MLQITKGMCELPSQEEENCVFTEVNTEHRCRIQSVPIDSTHRVMGSS